MLSNSMKLKWNHRIHMKYEVRRQFWGPLVIGGLALLVVSTLLPTAKGVQRGMGENTDSSDASGQESNSETSKPDKQYASNINVSPKYHFHDPLFFLLLISSQLVPHPIL